VDAFLGERNIRFTTWDGWYRLDAAEKALGAAEERERVKIVEREDMLKASGA
jgi:ferredoxin--NADP+ reductase